MDAFPSTRSHVKGIFLYLIYHDFAKIHAACSFGWWFMAGAVCSERRVLLAGCG
jgi:hypothetical protein